jgi:hypothetical protein
VCRGLDFDKLSRVAPPSGCALPGAQEKRQAKSRLAFFRLVVSSGAVLLVRCTYTRETNSDLLREPSFSNCNLRVRISQNYKGSYQKCCCG